MSNIITQGRETLATAGEFAEFIGAVFGNEQAQDDSWVRKAITAHETLEDKTRQALSAAQVANYGARLRYAHNAILALTGQPLPATARVTQADRYYEYNVEFELSGESFEYGPSGELRLLWPCNKVGCEEVCRSEGIRNLEQLGAAILRKNEAYTHVCTPDKAEDFSAVVPKTRTVGEMLDEVITAIVRREMEYRE